MTNKRSEHLCECLPEEELPIEKFRNQGPEALTDAELLAIIIRSGTQGANALSLGRTLCHLNDAYPGLLGLCHCTQSQLESIHGIGRVKAIQLLCITELSRRIAKTRMNREVIFRDSHTVAEYYMEDLRHAEREEARLLLLDTRLRLKKEVVLSKGTVNMAPISARELFREAVLGDAVSIILLHNHPTGDPTPSKEDILVTRQILEAGKILGITLIDHLIIGDQCYVSLKEYMSSKERN